MAAAKVFAASNVRSGLMCRSALMWKWHPCTTSSTCFSNVKLALRTTPSSLMDSVKSMRVPETSIPLDKWSCGSRLLSLVTDPSQFVLIQNLFMALNRFLCADVMCHEENTPSLGMFEIDMQSSLCIQKYRQKCLKKDNFYQLQHPSLYCIHRRRRFWHATLTTLTIT